MTNIEKEAFYYSGYGPCTKHTLAEWLKYKDKCKEYLTPADRDKK